MAIKGKRDAIVNGQQTEQFKIHSSVLKDFIFNNNSQRTYNPGKINRTVSIRIFQKVKMPVEMEEDISKAGVTFYPESLEYIFQVEGIAKKLLLFIVFHQLNPEKNTFLFNPQIIAAFNNYCLITTGKTYNADSVKQLLRKELVGRNIILNVNRGIYMLNPMIGGCTNFSVRKTLIDKYSDMLRKKHKNPFTDFYPKYSK